MENSNWKRNLKGDPEIKMGRHEGLYTRSYQEVRALYDAQIRNWEIEYIENLFHVINSDGLIELVYYDGKIGNCSCDHFLEVECGTCMHIEAVKLALYPLHNIEAEEPIFAAVKSVVRTAYNFRLNKVRPIRYVDHHFEVETIGSGDEVFETPSVPLLIARNERKQSHYPIDSITEFNVFQDYGINLFDFQLAAIKQMIYNMRTVLVLHMGLGKTLCALACSYILNRQRIIIIAPNSLKYQWQREIDRFNLGSSLVVSKGPDIQKYSNQRFLILSYEMLNSNPELLETHYDIVIADEIQKIKNRESKTWETVMQLKSDFVFALSGTPIQNSINDLISLIHFLNPQELKPEWRFFEEFCIVTKARILGIQKEKVHLLRQRLSRYIVNPKVDYTKFKPPTKNQEVIRTELTEEQRDLHDDPFDSAMVLIARSMNTPLSFMDKIRLNGLLAKARIAATDARLINPGAAKSQKFLRIEELIEKITQDRKVVVYSEWIKSLDLLLPALEEKKIGYVCFNGSLSDKKRNRNLLKFMQDPDVKVLLSTDTGGLGIDGLQLVCNDLIHVEKIWNPMKIEQRNGRLIRPLQKAATVNVYVFETNAGIEEMISENHGRKYSVIADMLS